MKRTGSTLKRAPVNETMLDGLGKALLAARRRWQRLDRESIRATFQELRKQRKYLIRQEDQYPPNDPLRLSFQCQRAIADLHVLELGKVASERRVKLPRVW